MRQSKRATRTREGYHWFRGWTRPSAAQRRVLDELVAGGTNAEIAERLGISEDGVKWHLGELREELELADRRELAAWWQTERTRRNVFLPFAGLQRQLGSQATAVIVGAAVIGSIAIAWFAYAGLEGDDAGTTRPLAAATPSSASAPAPIPTPTATPLPPTALLFDVEAASARALPGTLYFRRWLDTKALTFVGGDSGVSLIDAEGRLQPLPGTDNAAYYPIPDTSQVVLWHRDTGVLSLFDTRTMAQQTLADFGNVPAGHVVAVSVQSRKIAVGTYGGIELDVLELDGTGERRIYDAAGDQVITGAAWSPDGARLLVQLGRHNEANRSAGGFVVLDGAGRMQAGGSGTARWAGSQRLIVYSETSAGAATQRVAFHSLVDGSDTPVEGANSLICVSPDDRYGIWFTSSLAFGQPVTYELRLIATDETIVEVESTDVLFNCDWTPDSRKAILSPGGK